MHVRWLIWSIVSPSQLLLYAVILGALLLAANRSRVGRALSLAGGLGLLFFGLMPTAEYLMSALETRFPQPRLPQDITGIILLAGSERPEASQSHGEPQLGRNGGRHLTTLRLARQYPEAMVVFSGGPFGSTVGSADETSADIAAEIFRNSGIDARRITFDHASHDTCTSGTSTLALLKPAVGETWIVVTSAMHMPRTVACFRAAGWPHFIPQPADYQTVVGGWNTGSMQIAGNLALLDLACHEWIGLLYYRLTGRTRELFPGPQI